MFRRFSVGLGAVASSLGALWAYALVAGNGGWVTQQGAATWSTIVGCVGVAALLLAGWGAFAHANTGDHRWLSWVALSALSALPLFVGWFFLGLAATSR